jgi:O-antigen/teichoic acid export membrane protein
MGDFARDTAPGELKKKTARGALISTCAQATNLVLRTGSMMILARLLTPQDFGLVGMVTACTGFVALFQDAGLSMAAIQRGSVTHEQISTLFWLNILIGIALALICAGMAPILSAFFHEPRLFWVTVVVGSSFLFYGVGAQHRAMLQRAMRFATLTIIDLSSLLLSTCLGIGMARAGFGYWAVVCTIVAPIALNLFGLWTATGWRPGPPRRGCGVGSMVKYGGTITLNSVIVYFCYNLDKVLLGRFWGADVLGLYGRAYTLINLPTQTLNSTIAVVALPALARLQDEPKRLKNYFLKGYGLFLSLAIPIAMACAAFAEDIIHVFLGAKWDAAVPVFRLLTPMTFAFALFNPFGWFLIATGRATRSLHISFIIVPVVITGYLAGLSHGAVGVATGFSIATVILIPPILFWSTRGTLISVTETLMVVSRPLLAALAGTGAALAASAGLAPFLAGPVPRLFVASSVLFGVYGIILLFVLGQKTLYVAVLRDLGVWPFAVRQSKANTTELAGA